jgi:histone acetyltransferase (RNA polymerase elongator complex component)
MKFYDYITRIAANYDETDSIKILFDRSDIVNEVRGYRRQYEVHTLRVNGFINPSKIYIYDPAELLVNDTFIKRIYEDTCWQLFEIGLMEKKFRNATYYDIRNVGITDEEGEALHAQMRKQEKKREEEAEHEQAQAEEHDNNENEGIFITFPQLEKLLAADNLDDLRRCLTLYKKSNNYKLIERLKYNIEHLA